MGSTWAATIPALRPRVFPVRASKSCTATLLALASIAPWLPVEAWHLLEEGRSIHTQTHPCRTYRFNTHCDCCSSVTVGELVRVKRSNKGVGGALGQKAYCKEKGTTNSYHS